MVAIDSKVPVSIFTAQGWLPGQATWNSGAAVVKAKSTEELNRNPAVKTGEGGIQQMRKQG